MKPKEKGKAQPKEESDRKRPEKSRRIRDKGKEKDRITFLTKGRLIREEGNKEVVIVNDQKERMNGKGNSRKGKEGNRAQTKIVDGSEAERGNKIEGGKGQKEGQRPETKHIHVTQGKPLVDPSQAADAIPGPAYPVILPDKSDQKPFKLERIGHRHITQVLADHNGKISKAADALNVSHWTLKKYIDKHSDLKQILNLSKEAEVEYVEKQLLDQIKLGNVSSMIFYLKCHGKDRGWIEKPKDESDIKKPSVTFKYTLVLPGKKEPKGVTGRTTDVLQVEASEAIDIQGPKGRKLIEGVKDGA